MNIWTKILLTLSGILMSLNSFAQEGDKPEMADGLRSNGMIYVVVIVLLIVFAGIVLYLVSIDRKLKKIEKELKK